MKKIIRVIAALLAALLVCAIPLSGMAAGSAHVVHSDWNNKTRTKIITVEFTSASKNAKDFKVYIDVWCKVGEGGDVWCKVGEGGKARKVVDNQRIYLRKGTGITKDVWVGTGIFRINYGEEYNLRVGRGYCYYKYKVRYVYKGKTYIARRTNWIKA